MRKCLNENPDKRPSSEEIAEKNFEKLLPEEKMRDEEERPGTSSVEKSATTRNVRRKPFKKEKLKQVQSEGEMYAGNL